MRINPYLAFDGSCEAAFRFYERVLGGKLVMLTRYGDMPGADQQSPPAVRNRIMHARLIVGDRPLMGGDAPAGREPPQGYPVAIQVDSPEEAERLFKDLSEGGSITMPIGETFWAHRFGMLTDRFGIPWMINCEKSQ